MKIKYDKTAYAVYISIKKGSIKKTAHLSHLINSDFDKNGKILGIEILGASIKFSKSQGNSKFSYNIPVSVTI
jgi:uncharacterized protein YuzE